MPLLLLYVEVYHSSAAAGSSGRKHHSAGTVATKLQRMEPATGG